MEVGSAQRVLHVLHVVLVVDGEGFLACVGCAACGLSICLGRGLWLWSVVGIGAATGLRCEMC